MITVLDVARFILNKQALLNNEAIITTWKLQKLAYYSQAWATVWDDERIFVDRIEAWANGPVTPVLYEVHKGKFKVSSRDIMGDWRKIKNYHRDTILEVIRFYGKETSQYLSELAHHEKPWIYARKGLSIGERGNNEITLDSMAEYYGGLYEASQS